MRQFKTNSPEHRQAIIEAIQSKNFYLLSQLHEAITSRHSRVVVLESFFDLFMHSSQERQEDLYESIAHREILEFGPYANGFD
jgi:hypothetical protein